MAMRQTQEMNKKLIIDGIEIPNQALQVSIETLTQDATFQGDFQSYTYSIFKRYKITVEMEVPSFYYDGEAIILFTKTPHLEEWQKAYAKWRDITSEIEMYIMAIRGDFESDKAQAFKAGYERVALEDYVYE